MQNSEGDRSVELVLAGDDDGIEQALLGCIVQGVCKGDGRTQVLGLSEQPDALHAGADQRCILPVAREKRRGQPLSTYS